MPILATIAGIGLILSGDAPEGTNTTLAGVVTTGIAYTVGAPVAVAAGLVLTTSGGAEIYADMNKDKKDADKDSLTFTTQQGYEFINNVPTNETSKQMYRDADVQRGAVLYQWAMPFTGLMGWENANKDMGNTELDGLFSSYKGKQSTGILTPNEVVTYMIGFGDTNVNGPIVWEVPAGLTAGYVGDQWQRPIMDAGITGPEKGAGVKFLIVGPNQEVPEHDSSYTVVHSPTNVVWLGTRNMETDPVKYQAIQDGFTAYPFNKPELRGREHMSKDTDIFKQAQPRGMAYWDSVNTMVQREVMNERDVFFYAMLKDLGIEKGKDFNPTKEQAAILIEAEELGYLQAINNTYKKRFADANYYGDRNWYNTLVNSPDQIQDTHGELAERASWFHEAIGSTYAMKLDKPGPGNFMMASYEDVNGHGYDGAKSYTLNIPADVPMKQFWALTVYDSKYRSLIPNDGQSEVNSSRGVVTNKNGSVDVFIGPSCDTSKGCTESNYIQTSEGQTWFTYFRLYNPTQAHFDKTWKLNDIVEISNF